MYISSCKIVCYDILEEVSGLKDVLTLHSFGVKNAKVAWITCMRDQIWQRNSELQYAPYI